MNRHGRFFGLCGPGSLHRPRLVPERRRARGASAGGAALDFAAMAATPRELPSPEAILDRENAQRRVAVLTAVASAIVTALAVIVEQLINAAGPPKADKAADLIETLNAQATGAEFPTSFWTAYAKFQVDHANETILVAGLRGIALFLLIPIVLFLFRGARDRGGSLARWLDPLVITCLAMAAFLTIAEGVLQVQAFKAASPEYVPAAILDEFGSSDLLAATSIRGFLSIGIGIPIALASIQALRLGLLPRILGFMGVLVGLLFVIVIDPSGLIRAIWFALVAWTIAGRLPSGPVEAWVTGKAVAPAPRQPPAPREPKGKTSKGPKLTK